MLYSLFFELIKVALGQKDSMSHTPTSDEWKTMLQLAQKQSLVGVCFTGVERLPKEQMPPKHLLLNWYVATQQIEERNKTVNQRTVSLCEHLHKDGYKCCILKGQSVALFYPNPLRRQSGDIDVWVRTDNGSMESDQEELITKIRSKYPDADVCYLHADYPVFKDVEVELHFMPTRLYCKTADKRLQAWIEKDKDGQFKNEAELPEGKMSVATDEFNAIFLLLHIAKHILEEGIGLRQLMDYYYFLVKCGDNIDRAEFIRLFKSFNMYKIAQAVMYVLQSVFGLSSDKLPCPANEKYGRFLIEEIMLSGNFGHYDPRFGEHSTETPLQKFIRKQTRVVRFFALSPTETLWSPLYSIYQRVWRKRRGLV